jgi:hypothetical protein
MVGLSIHLSFNPALLHQAEQLRFVMPILFSCPTQGAFLRTSGR